MQNIFSTLDALAKVLPFEFVADEPQAVTIEHRPRYGVNIGKLVRHNLRQPFDKRICLAELQEKVSFAHVRAKLVSLHAQISREVESELQAQRGLTDALMEM